MGIGDLKNLAFQTASTIFQREVLKPLLEDPQLREILKSCAKGPGDCHNRWFAFVKGAVDKSLFKIGHQMFHDAEATACGLPPFLTSIGSAGTLVSETLRVTQEEEIL